MIEVSQAMVGSPKNLNVLNNNIMHFNQGDASVTEFKDLLNNATTLNIQNTLSNLLLEFDRQEKIMRENPSISNISEYKKILGNILSVAASNYKSSSITVYSNEGYKKLLNYSEIIDQKTDSIMKDFLENKSLSLKSMSDISDIKGLILDITI